MTKDTTQVREIHPSVIIQELEHQVRTLRERCLVLGQAAMTEAENCKHLQMLVEELTLQVNNLTAQLREVKNNAS